VSIRDRVRELTPKPVTESIRRSLVVYGEKTSGRRPLPEFLIIGTKRGGTTSLWNYMIKHPLVPRLFPAWNTKTSHYFEENWYRGVDWYRSHFPTEAQRATMEREHGGAPKAGEAAPLYMFHPLAAARVHALMPEVKLIVLLRDPVERAYSHWKERTTEGKETLDFPTALAREAERTTGERERLIADPNLFSEAYDWYTYRARGRYLEHLEPWLELFRRDQMYIVQSEVFYREPARVLGEIQEFVGLPRYDIGSYEVFNARRSASIPEAVREELTEYYRPYNRALADRLGMTFDWESA